MDRRNKRPREGGESTGANNKRGSGLAPEEFTNDPNTVSSRIFIGGIPDDISRDELKEHFSKYGNISSVSITKNKFGFVQYETAEAAEFCLSHGFSQTVKGHKVDVKPAKIGSGGNKGGGGGGNSNHSGYRSQRDRYSPGPGRGGGDYFPPDMFSRDERIMPWGGGHYPDEFMHDPFHRERLPFPPRDDGFYRGEERLPPRGFAPSAAAAATPEPLDPLDPNRPNDVEIVVPSKQQRPFAEGIEGQLKRMQMKVDLLFPPPEVSPTQVIQDLSSRRCLFALFATSENEQHHSVTVNILHGVPQEHRNMPVEDALRLIQQNFDEYVKKSRLRNMREAVPRDVRDSLIDLLEMKPISMGDLDKMIKYLRERQGALVDDQIEQKAGSKASLPAGLSTMAVTYPGYNYVTNPGAALPGSSGIAAQAVSLVPAQVAYGNPQGVVGFGMSGQPAVTQLIAGGSDGQQDRYMQMGKGGQGQAQPMGVAAPTGVPAPQGMGGQRDPSGPSSWSSMPNPKMDGTNGAMWGGQTPQFDGQGSSAKQQNKPYNPWGT